MFMVYSKNARMEIYSDFENKALNTKFMANDQKLNITTLAVYNLCTCVNY